MIPYQGAGESEGLLLLLQKLAEACGVMLNNGRMCVMCIDQREGVTAHMVVKSLDDPEEAG
jgi:hypothetical protein